LRPQIHRRKTKDIFRGKQVSRRDREREREREREGERERKVMNRRK
jgi:hypothetical protein